MNLMKITSEMCKFMMYFIRNDSRVSSRYFLPRGIVNMFCIGCWCVTMCVLVCACFLSPLWTLPCACRQLENSPSWSRIWKRLKTEQKPQKGQSWAALCLSSKLDNAVVKRKISGNNLLVWKKDINVNKTFVQAKTNKNVQAYWDYKIITKKKVLLVAADLR